MKEAEDKTLVTASVILVLKSCCSVIYKVITQNFVFTQRSVLGDEGMVVSDIGGAVTATKLGALPQNFVC